MKNYKDFFRNSNWTKAENVFHCYYFFLFLLNLYVFKWLVGQYSYNNNIQQAYKRNIKKNRIFKWPQVYIYRRLLIVDSKQKERIGDHIHFLCRQREFRLIEHYMGVWERKRDAISSQRFGVSLFSYIHCAPTRFFSLSLSLF